MLCCGVDPESTINQTSNADNWLKVFNKFKDFLLVSICDEELCSDALIILHNFLTSPALKFSVYEECKDNLVKSIDLLYAGNSKMCQEAFRNYLE